MKTDRSDSSSSKKEQKEVEEDQTCRATANDASAAASAPKHERVDDEKTDRNGDVEADIGIFSFSVHGTTVQKKATTNKESSSSLKGFCETYKKVRSMSTASSSSNNGGSSRRSSHKSGGQEWPSDEDKSLSIDTETKQSGVIACDENAVNKRKQGVQSDTSARDETHTETSNKKQRGIAHEHNLSSLFLQCPRDVRGHIYSFFTLKEAVPLRFICHWLDNDADIYRYSDLRCSEDVEETKRQEKALCNLTNMESFRAVLANETLPQSTINGFLKSLIEQSTTDNGEAISILLQDGRTTVEPNMLDVALRKGYSAMAEKLQQNDIIRAGIRMCTSCSQEIGAFECLKGARCRGARPADGEGNVSSALVPKFCCQCARANQRFCLCGEVLCQECFPIRCSDCPAFCCGRDQCKFHLCPDCGEATRCNSCARASRYHPYCSIQCTLINYDSYYSYDDDHSIDSYDYGGLVYRR